MNDSSILYSQQPLISSIKGLILNSLSSSNQPNNFNYSCLTDIITEYFDSLSQTNDFYDSLLKIREPILNCYSDQIVSELKNFIVAFSSDLPQLVSDKTSLEDMILSVGKYAEFALKLLIDILRNQIKSTTITTTTYKTTPSTISNDQAIVSQIESIKNSLINNLIGKKTTPYLNDLVNDLIV